MSRTRSRGLVTATTMADDAPTQTGNLLATMMPLGALASAGWSAVWSMNQPTVDATTAATRITDPHHGIDRRPPSAGEPSTSVIRADYAESGVGKARSRGQAVSEPATPLRQSGGRSRDHRPSAR